MFLAVRYNDRYVLFHDRYVLFHDRHKFIGTGHFDRQVPKNYFQACMVELLSFQLNCSSNIDSIHYLGLTNSFHQVPRDIHTLPVKEPIPSIW